MHAAKISASESKHEVSFIHLKVVAGGICNITPVILQPPRVGLFTEFHSASRMVLVSFK